MLKLYYSEDMLRKTVKKDINDLVGTLSQFHKFDSEERQKYAEEIYKTKIIGIASNLKDLMETEDYKPLKDLVALLNSTDEFDNFNPRFVQDFEGRWTKEIDQKAKINQDLIEISRKYSDNQSLMAVFAVFNAIKYISGKDIEPFELIVEKTKDKYLKHLITESWKKFDVFECPFDATMEGYCSVFSKSGEIYARFGRDEFELYLLNKIYQSAVQYVENCIYNNRLKEIFENYLEEWISLKPVYSDTTVEKLDSVLDSTEIASMFITTALKNAARTKTRLEFDGKDRVYFLHDIDLFADEIHLKNVSGGALSGSYEKHANHRIRKLVVEKAGGGFGLFSNFNCEEMYLEDVGSFSLSGLIFYKKSRHNIGKLTVENAGDGFGFYSTLYTDKDKLELSGNIIYRGKIKDINRKWWEFWK